MTAQLATIPPQRVYLADGVVRVEGLASADPDLVTLVAGASDPEAVVQRALSTGARALAVAHVSIDTAMVETSFAALQNQLRALVDDAATQVTGTTSELLADPEQGLPATLRSWKADVSALLEQTFDPQHSGSAFGKLDVVLQDASERQLSATRRLLNPDADDSPLSRLMAGVRDQIATVLDAVARLAEQTATDKATTLATAAALERSAVKGMVYEDQVMVAVATLATERGDAAGAVGHLAGGEGGRVGDIVVDIDPASNGGRSGAYVVECKDRRLSFKATRDELRRAAGNRSAHAAIAVFSRAENAPVPSPFAVFDDHAIVVYDKDEADPSALRLACAWARWIVQRETRPSDTTVNVELVGRLIDDARRALDRVSAIKRAHTAATKKIGEATSQVAELNAEVTEALERVERALTPDSVA